MRNKKINRFFHWIVFFLSACLLTYAICNHKVWLTLTLLFSVALIVNGLDNGLKPVRNATVTNRVLDKIRIRKVMWMAQINKIIYLLLIIFLYSCKGEKEMIFVGDQELYFYDSIPQTRYSATGSYEVMWYIYKNADSVKHYRYTYEGVKFIAHPYSITKQ